MKIRITIGILLLNLFGQVVLAEVTAISNTELSLNWQPIENNYLGKEQALSVLEIRNTGTKILPKRGWHLYFNFVRIITPKNKADLLDVKHINGDLSCITPTSQFEGLKPGESIRFEIISNSWIVNKSDAPQGFYLVWDESKKIEVLEKVNLSSPSEERKFYRFAGDKEISAEAIFEDNLKIIDIPENRLIKIFPTPKYYKENEGYFKLSSSVKIGFDAKFENEAKLLSAELTTLFGKKVSYRNLNKISNPEIILMLTSAKEEAYELSINGKNIIISAGSSSGIFYGIQSLKTLIDPLTNKNKKATVLSISQVEVKDEPRFAYRGVMLDVARNFQPKKEILKLIDLLAQYKLNTLHFHLNDDEGWRLEIPSIPELTAFSSKRGHNLDEEEQLPPSYGSGPFVDKNSGSGYYSKKDFIEILKYAKERHITVIPEIETPGHARAAIKAMDYRYRKLMKQGKVSEAEKYRLHDSNDKSTYRSVQKWNDNVIDVAMPSAYTFLEVVTDDLISIYKQAGAPLKTIHFGGDEVPAGVWEQSPAFSKLKITNISVVNTTDLWNHYFGKINSMLKSRGLYLSGWEEVGLTKHIIDGKKKWLTNNMFKAENIHLNVWNNLLGNEDLAYRLANSGFKVVLSFVSNFYFDMAYHKKFTEPGFYWGGFIELDKPFSFIPFDYLKNQQKNYLGRQLSDQVLSNAAKLTESGKENVVGLQGQIWSETVKDSNQLEYLLLPRLFALAERAWTQSPDWAAEKDVKKASALYNTSLSHFYNVVGKRELRRLDYSTDSFKYRIPSPGLKKENDKVSANVQVPGFFIRYTNDGTLPTEKSEIYNGPVQDNGKLVFAAFNSLGRSSTPSMLKN